MPTWTCIPAMPRGFVLIQFNGSTYLKASDSINSPGVGGEELDAVDILNIRPGESECHPGSKWQIAREGDAIVFEMIDHGSEVDWGVPLKMTIPRAELVEVAQMFRLE